MKQNTFVLLAVLAIGINTAFWLRLKGHPGIFAENGPMENFQAVCLGLSFLLWLIAGVMAKDRWEKILLISLAVLNLSFLIHEVETRDLSTPILAAILNGRVRDAWLGALWLACVIFFLKNRKPVWNGFLSWIKTPSGIVMIVSGLFWIASGMNDKEIFVRKNLYGEELIEVNSTLLMLLSVILFFAMRKNKNPLQKIETPLHQQPP